MSITTKAEAMTTLEVDRGHLEITRQRNENLAEVWATAPNGSALLRVDGFALTSNNITYAVFGDGLRYWDFFPAQADDDHLWGRIPVWGFATVEETRCDGVKQGDRVYGYLPMSSHLVVQPGRVDERGWIDIAPHRSAMASAYNRYVLTTVDPVYKPHREAEQMILWPLFMTSFMIDDHIAASMADAVGNSSASVAGTMIISSASSKTAMGTAYLARQRSDMRVVGLTSTANEDFVRSLGCYHQVITYDRIDEQLAEVIAGGADAGAIAYVDIAGNQTVTRAVHAVLGDQLQQSLVVGGTHWDANVENASDAVMSGPKPEFFFAPTLIAQRTKEWGREVFEARVGSAWETWVEWCGSWMVIDRAEGVDAVMSMYHKLLVGDTDPRHGVVARI